MTQGKGTSSSISTSPSPSLSQNNLLRIRNDNQSSSEWKRPAFRLAIVCISMAVVPSLMAGYIVRCHGKVENYRPKSPLQKKFAKYHLDDDSVLMEEEFKLDEKSESNLQLEKKHETEIIDFDFSNNTEKDHLVTNLLEDENPSISPKLRRSSNTP